VIGAGSGEGAAVRARRVDGVAIARHLVLAAMAVLTLLPLAWMVATSFKPPGEIFSDQVRWLPEQWHAIANYRQAFVKAPLLRYLLNGVVVTLSIFVLQVAVALPCAYAIAKLRFRGRDTVFTLVLLGLMVPAQAVSVPIFLLFHHLGLLNSYAALILPWSLSVFGIFLMRQFFRTVPDDLLHAARLDGMSEFGIVWRVMLPTAMPALVAFGMLSLVWNWNDFFWPLLVIQTESLATPPLGVVFFNNAEAGTNYGPLMAAATVITAPLVIAFLVAQRWFIDGVTMTAVK
jgi:multiple sugar transport system permease protein